MADWKEVTLREISKDISYGYTASATDTPTGTKFLRITDIVKDKINWESVPYCQISDADAKKYRLSIGDIVIARTGATTGYNAIIKDEVNAVFASYLIRYKINKSLAHPFFVGYVLQSDRFQDYVDAIAGGSAQPGANAQQLADFEFTLPPLAEQQAIAEVLSSLDDKIDLLHRQNKTLEAMAETLFRQWFVEEADESWERAKIGDVLRTELGGTPSTTKPEYWDGDISWINSGEVNKFRIIESSRFITKLGLEKSNCKLLPKGTTVLAITGATLGQVSLLEIDTCANQSVVGIIPNERISKEYVFLWVKHKIEEIIMNETGGAQPHINKNDVNETEIIIPPKAQSEEKLNVLSDYFEKITKNVFQIRSLTKLRDELLPKLMSGDQVRVKTTGAETAAVNQ